MNYKDYFKQFENDPDYQGIIKALEDAEREAVKQYPHIDRLTISDIIESGFIAALKLTLTGKQEKA